MNLRFFVTLSAVTQLVACGSAPDERGGTGLDPASVGETTEPADLPACAPESPAGEPCIDELGAVLCPVETGFPGDDLALCDQGREAGLLVHYGPNDFDNPDDVATYLLEAGGEDENCSLVRTRNESERFVKAYRGRMRPGSHHLIITQQPEEGFVETDVPGPCNLADTVSAEWLVGSQDPQIDIDIGGSALGGGNREPEPGDPDYRLGQQIAARTPLQLDMHYTNPTDQTIVREAWVWFDYAEPSEIETLVDMITFYQGQITVPPQSEFTTRRARCEAATDRYIGLVTGHAHETMTRFSVWHENSAGTERLIYETYDWADPGNLFYRDSVENPEPDPVAGTHGGASGFVHVLAGEALTFQCEYFNPGSTEVTLGDTTDDEMCNVFGMYFPTDGNVWNCACLGAACVDEVPEGVDIAELLGL